MTETSAERLTDVEAFSHAPLFHGVDGETLRRLAADARTITLRGGDYLFRGGDAADRLYVVRTGRLRVLVEAEEGPKVVRELGPGDVLGELALLTGSPRSASAQAVRDSELLSLDAARFDALIADDPGFSRALLRELARQLQASGGLTAPSTRPSVFSVVPLCEGPRRRQAGNCDRPRAGPLRERRHAPRGRRLGRLRGAPRASRGRERRGRAGRGRQRRGVGRVLP